jgi:hypothetical protein
LRISWSKARSSGVSFGWRPPCVSSFLIRKVCIELYCYDFVAVAGKRIEEPRLFSTLIRKVVFAYESLRRKWGLGNPSQCN